MNLRSSDGSGWNMSPDAEKKRNEMVKGWDDNGERMKGLEQLRAHVQMPAKSRSQIQTQDKYFKPQDGWNTNRSRYLADKRGVDVSNNVQQTIELDEYVKDLKEFKIVKDVYVLSDDRADGGNIAILIKLKPLLSIPANVFDAENARITTYLQSTKIANAEEIEVSFQYTEVFK
jgi:hypothetical protein